MHLQEFFKKVLYNCNNPVLRIYQEFSLPGLKAEFFNKYAELISSIDVTRSNATVYLARLGINRVYAKSKRKKEREKEKEAF